MNIMVFDSPICSSCSEAIKVVRAVVEEYELRVKSTPSIFINQTNILGIPTKERLEIVMEKELAR